MNKKIYIALAQLNPKVGDIKGNVSKLLKIRNDLGKNIDMLQSVSKTGKYKKTMIPASPPI